MQAALPFGSAYEPADLIVPEVSYGDGMMLRAINKHLKVNDCEDP